MKRREIVLDLFRSCSNCSSVIQLHSLTIKTGFLQDSFIAAKLSNCYAKYATLETTCKLFDETLQPTVYLWNSILKCYCKEMLYVETLQLFRDMNTVEKPDQATISIALKACSGLLELRYGRMLHGFVKKSYEMDSDLFVGSSLIEMYSKGGQMDEALRVFEEYPEPDIVMWTHIVTGYQHNDGSDLALEFFSRMLMEGNVNPDSVTLVSVLSASAQLVNVMAGSCVHGFVIKKGFDKGLSVCNALLNFYVKCGCVSAAAMLFREMKQRDIISWASMISCYAHNGAADEALNLFNEMMRKGVEANSVSVISALQACEATGNLEEGKKIHELAARKGFELDAFVSTSLIDMYMNCSSPDEAIELFKRMAKKDAVSWMTLINGCVQNGMAFKSIELFVNMLSNEIQPDVILMVKILTACSNLGVLQQALCLHSYVIKCGFEYNPFVGASLIESYSKCGSLCNAIKVFKGIDHKDVVIWSSMIAGYGIHGKGREALELFDYMVKISTIKPNNVTFLSILSACSHAGLIKEGVELFNTMLNEYRLTPESNHYAIMVDLFGRMGELDKAIGVINDMGVPAGPQIWGALLGACRIHHNTKLGDVAATNLFLSDSSQAGYLILLSNMHAANNDWDIVAKLRTMIKRNKLLKVHGQSAIEVKSEVNSFKANDRIHPQAEAIHGLLWSLEMVMREDGYVRDMG
ncbi:putative pentatricopeptide repeat-containing protein At3g01580 isoform X2 [Cynara cardunculus var. scolymus]|uniref:Pentatricopeptide repeat-containing protein n=2 Tax=Cynara cardunculus var. scolymus TaxID=59895 RepID=A0A118K5K9_CYNCS|nr:putative pentatricopeptide repeat-containing protein At3g01580 isoform X2 [Cynara cardunculus var. scolymus]XP_024962384.1 putative pentatricopeptide repeat-containing protein At3g01580 isoform X2 [Cynara cardunculus var. scolymus]XP_024962390.1 putative pentatricopeptide repeat-containing protein At3g01580 isoform X2 [Cynara cardunculus var. scolymus]KVI09257.1 Pentatricopeptide repeat-containing protein [Cynara cardunculus var. scolymus]